MSRAVLFVVIIIIVILFLGRSALTKVEIHPQTRQWQRALHTPLPPFSSSPPSFNCSCEKVYPSAVVA